MVTKNFNSDLDWVYTRLSNALTILPNGDLVARYSVDDPDLYILACEYCVAYRHVVEAIRNFQRAMAVRTSEYDCWDQSEDTDLVQENVNNV